MVKIAPSILSANFAILGQEVQRVDRSGADWVHVDVMDGVFVPNISFGPTVIKHVRPHSRLPFDVHLMIVKPERYLKQFADAGADLITVHIEASDQVAESLGTIHVLGKGAGVSVNPETAFERAMPYLDKIELLLIMSVHPGFGGQSFIPDVVPKIREAMRLKEENGYRYEIEVDGGINRHTAKVCIDAGATVLVAGNALFGLADMGAELAIWKGYDQVSKA
jgi:ribulose-phosphate 3-epimerase